MLYNSLLGDAILSKGPNAERTYKASQAEVTTVDSRTQKGSAGKNTWNEKEEWPKQNEIRKIQLYLPHLVQILFKVEWEAISRYIRECSDPI